MEHLLRPKVWLIGLPTIFAFLLSFSVTNYIPDQFETRSHLLYVYSPSEEKARISERDFRNRLEFLRGALLNKDFYEKLIIDWELYEDERAKGESIESLSVQMRKRTKIEIMPKKDYSMPNFFVKYESSNQHEAKLVNDQLVLALTSDRADFLCNSFITEDFESKLAAASIKLEIENILSRHSADVSKAYKANRKVSSRVLTVKFAAFPKTSSNPDRALVVAIGTGFGLAFGVLLVSMLILFNFLGSSRFGKLP